MSKREINQNQFHWIILIIIMLIGIAIRLYDLQDPPLDFHPARQLHSAMIARGEYARLNEDAYPGPERALIAAQWASELRIEPPIIEIITSRLFYLFNTDELWIARLLSIFFWVVGGFGLYFLVRNLSGVPGALFAVAFYMILPYGVIASRSFQPDPLMVALMIYSFLFYLRWSEKKSWKSAIWAGVLGGSAILVKQVAIFFLAAAGLMIVFSEMGIKDSLKNAQAWLVAGLTLLPSLVYNLFGIFVDGSLLGQYSKRFFPEMLIDPGFYIRWSRLADMVIPLEFILLSLVGILLLESRKSRLFGVSLFAGYIFLGLGLSHHISTHDYYHLPLIPLVAVGLAPVFELILKELNRRLNRISVVFSLSIILLGGGALNLYESYSTLKKADYRDQPETWPHLVELMGGYNAVSIGLYEDYGASQIYYGYNYPLVYPSLGDIKFTDIEDNTVKTENIEFRMQDRSFFVVTDFEELNQQPDLKAYLVNNYALIESGDWYQIYHIREEINAPE
ncbi:MAG: glycosyltransferase family 39 protein [Anaerolineaceae bacterium]|nr:glycosyltransferase family 39 protein [Anaerolineaceae bacterium]